MGGREWVRGMRQVKEGVYTGEKGTQAGERVACWQWGTVKVKYCRYMTANGDIDRDAGR